MIATVIVSCSKDDDDDGYTFLDQDAQGKIGGADWNLNAGTAEIDSNDSTLLYLRLYVAESDDPCSEWTLEGNRVIFSVPDAVGLYELVFDWTSDENQTLTLFDSENSMNTVATDGAIEITLIDKENGIVEGRVAASVDSNDNVNGNFTVDYCAYIPTKK